jgi:hypothetical protein
MLWLVSAALAQDRPSACKSPQTTAVLRLACSDAEVGKAVADLEGLALSSQLPAAEKAEMFKQGGATDPTGPCSLTGKDGAPMQELLAAKKCVIDHVRATFDKLKRK